VAILTGFRTPPRYVQETDGPLGAALLSRCLSSFNLKPYIMFEDVLITKSAIKSITHSIGLDVELIPLPVGTSLRSELKILRTINDINPSIAIFIEKPGPNRFGIYHSMKGIDITKYHVNVIPLLEYFKRNNIPTIGIGDGGNEVGMGVVEESVRKYVPYGNMCNCPCRGGIASSAKTDGLIISLTSNLGAYELGKMIYDSYKMGKCLINESLEEVMLRAAVNSGCIDGVLGTRSLSVDGIFLDRLKDFIRYLVVKSPVFRS